MKRPAEFGPFLSAVCLAGMLSCNMLSAQETPSLPATNAAASKEAASGLTASGHPANDFWIARDKQILTDFPWLAKFKQADATLGQPAPGEDRVVFVGDSITAIWHLDEWFPGKSYINRGIGGQTAPQMVLRFRQDVIDLKPRAVVILAGTNDVFGNTGVETNEEIEGYLASMSELAQAHHIRVVLCSILPAFDHPWKSAQEPAPRIVAINAWLKDYAAHHGDVYVDYHTAMKDDLDGLPAALTRDGVHPLPAGYAIMAPLVQAGIEKALK